MIVLKLLEIICGPKPEATSVRIRKLIVILHTILFSKTEMKYNRK
jgi:hypothetical protein